MDHNMGIDCAMCKQAWATVPAKLNVGEEVWEIGLCEECVERMNWEPVKDGGSDAHE